VSGKLAKVLRAAWQSSDPTITTPDEIHVYPDGSALACHASSGDVGYDSLADLEAAYLICVAQDEVAS
jgi:hypothetical protein